MPQVTKGSLFQEDAETLIGKKAGKPLKPASDNLRLVQCIEKLASLVGSMELREKIDALNFVRGKLHEISPFASEPVDCVQWFPLDEVSANDYNPNSVAAPEMELLKHSVLSDGYTQPIVAWPTDDGKEVVDGFHRNLVGRDCPEVRERCHGYLPLTIINPSREDRGDRIASTIRHNRARGKHAVSSMSEIVVELKRRNWSDKKIGKELGMDPDEVLRLSQISGLMEMFQDVNFTEAWECVESDTEGRSVVHEPREMGVRGGGDVQDGLPGLDDSVVGECPVQSETVSGSVQKGD